MPPLPDNKKRVVRILFLTNFLIGLTFSILFIFFPEIILNFINWPFTDSVSVRMFGGALLALSGGSFLAMFKDEYKEIQLILETQIIWLIIGEGILAFSHYSYGFPISAWYLDAIFIALFVCFIIVLNWIRQ